MGWRGSGSGSCQDIFVRSYRTEGRDWTLQVRDTGLCAALHPYLMMPEAERKKTEFSITDPSANKSRAKTSVVREPGMSVTDTAKKVMEKISTNLSNKLDDGKRLCAQELETDSDSECDDVFS